MVVASFSSYDESLEESASEVGLGFLCLQLVATEPSRQPPATGGTVLLRTSPSGDSGDSVSRRIRNHRSSKTRE
jgi:hypothetical protein